MSPVEFNYNFLSNETYFLFILGIILFDVPRYALASIAIMFRSKAKRHLGSYAPKVSVIVSSYNGEQHIADTIRSIQHQTYKPTEIIIVNDGSVDATQDIIESAYHQGYVTNIIHHRHRAGKSASVNHAARFATGDLIVNIDDDTVLAPDAIQEIISVFSDPKIVIASGALDIRNSTESLFTSLQSIEYCMSMNGGRSFLDTFNALSCCSGAFSCFRSSFFSRCHGLHPGPGEDLEITLRARQLGFDSKFVESAKASVLAPETLGSLLKQRLRWDRDEYNIRVNQYVELNPFQSMNRLSEYFHAYDFYFFNLLPTLMFPFYLIYVYSIFGNMTLEFLLFVYLYVYYFYYFIIAINLISNFHYLTIFDLLTIAIFPFYQGMFMKAVRLYAYSVEILFSQSQYDDYVPFRIRHAIYKSRPEPQCP